MRALYADQQEILVVAAKRELIGMLEVHSAEADMHLVGRLPTKVSDKAASEKAARYGVEAAPLSAYSTNLSTNGGLVLGYTALNPRQIRDGVRRLAQSLA